MNINQQRQTVTETEASMKGMKIGRKVIVNKKELEETRTTNEKRIKKSNGAYV